MATPTMTADRAAPHAPGDRAPRVLVEDSETMNLLGLLLRSVLERTLADPTNARRAARLRGELVVRGGRMRVAIRFGGPSVTVTRTIPARPRARVEGNLAAFLSVALGRGLVGALLRRRIVCRGNLLFLLRLLPLLRAPANGEHLS